ncbi:unnamed protein product [Brachionus calyciflorus]|uniref:FRY n=1 Tax=Brachionus calyciflorus TaxID=104777 RepID=A0A813Y676_9BILA|nr:unnamed protein product [Brachionus calyciflorus]
MIEPNNSGTNGDSSAESPSNSANTSTNKDNKKETEKDLPENIQQQLNNSSKSSSSLNQDKFYYTKLPWGVLKETPSLSNNLFNLISSSALSNVNINDEFFKIEKKKPGEYLMNLVVFNFIQLSSKKLDQIINGDKRDKRLKECFQKNDDPQFDKLVTTMSQVAEQSLPSLVRTLLMWHEAQISNLNFLKLQNQQLIEANGLNPSSKVALKTKQHLIQVKMETEILDERKELVVNCLLCTALREILKQLPFHPGIDDLLNYVIDLSFQRFLSKETSSLTSSYVQHHQLFLDNQFTTDLFAECIGVMAQSRFALVKRRFISEFDRIKLYKSPGQSTAATISTNLSNTQATIQQQTPNTPIQSNQLQNLDNSNTASIINSSVSAPNITQTLPVSPSSSNIIKLLTGMKFFRIKMVPIEDFEASFQFLNEFAQYFVDVKDKDIKHTLAGLFVEILVPITGIVKNEVNIPCLKLFVDILYQHAWELSAKTKHRLATLPLLTCLLCVSQKQFFLNYWFPLAQLCFQQFKSKETTLSRIALESILRLVWVYMIRIKGEKSSDTNQRLNAIIQSIFPKGTKIVIPKEMPANIYVKIISYIAYEKLDYAMKEIIYELLSIDTSQNLLESSEDTVNTSQGSVSNSTSLGSQVFRNSKENMILIPLRMEIGLKSFVSIADNLQYQKENGLNPPQMPNNFTTPNTDTPSIYLKNSGSINPQKITLNDSLSKEIGLGIYFENVRRAYQDILKTLDYSIGRTFLMTRPENTGSASNEEGLNHNQTENNLEQEQTSSENLDDLTSNNTNKDLIFNSEHKSRLSLFRTCIALMPRLMPCFKENELVDILTRLTIHLDDELKFTSFQTLKTLVSEYPNWRKFIFIGFTSFILKEISDMFPKLIENALKMLIQLLNTWKNSTSLNTNLDECCKILFHLEGFSLFTLCHSNIQRRRYALLILKECKQIGESTKCFKIYPHHNYVIDILDLASIQCMKSLHLQCFNSNLTTSNIKPDLGYLIDQSSLWDSCINLSNYNDNNNFSQSNSLPNQVSLSGKNQRAPSVSNSIETTNEQVDFQNETQTSPSSAPSSLPNNFNINIPSFQNSPQINSQTIQTNLNNIFTFDPWTECLAIFFSYDFVFTKCPQARCDAWPFIYTRLQQILPFVDPNRDQPEVPRTSILFGVGSNSLEKQRKAASERDINLNLWKNYLMGACCLTSGQDQYLYYREYEKYLKTSEERENLFSSQSNLLNPNPPAVNVDFTIYESTSKFYANFGTATSLIKMIVPFLRCESLYFREVIIRALGRINIEAQRDLIEELNPFVKETSDFKRVEKVRRLKKKDWTRLALVRIFELMAEQQTLGKRILETYKENSKFLNSQQFQVNDEIQLRKSFMEFIETMYGYLESENERFYDHINQIRLHFSMFIYKLIDSIPKDKRNLILNDLLRQNLFNLILKWCGKFYVTSKDSTKLNTFTKNLSIHQNHYHLLNCYHYYEELELAATRACAAILYSGNVLDYSTNKNSVIFNWLNNLVEIANLEMKFYDNCKSQVSNEIYTIAFNCLEQLLDLSLYKITSSNPPNSNNTINLSTNNSPIFEWVIDKCYATMSQEIADLCFLSLSKVYLNYLNQAKPYHLSKNNLLKSSFESIYLGPIMTLILLNLGSSRPNLHEASVTLLRMVNKNFLTDNFDSKIESKSSTLSSSNNLNSLNSFLNVDFDIINSLVISSKSQAFISEYLAKKNPEQTMFIFSELTSHFETCTSNSLRRTMLNVLVPWFYNLELVNPNVVSDVKKNTLNNVLQLQSGYGSVEATHLILNNLFYLTCKFGDQFSTEFELLWAILASTWRSNLKIIFRFISVMTTLAPYEVLSHGKKIICFLSRVCPDRIIDELINELELVDSFNSIIEKMENQFPFYKYNRPVVVPVSPPPSPKLTNNPKKSSIYFVNQEEDDDEDLIDDDNESIEFVNQSDFNLDDEESESDNTDSDDSDSEYSQSDTSETEYFKNITKKSQASLNQLKINLDTSQLPLPTKFQSFACPLNKLIYHLGHHHNQQTVYPFYQNQAPVFSYHNNYLHHNHYQHINYLQRGTVALMLLTELVCNDGADFDWTQYLPILLHYCLINFDNTKQIVTEHAKKLFLSLIYILTVQNELYLLTDYLIESIGNIIDNQSIIYDRKYKSVDSEFMNGSCHYNFNFNARINNVLNGINLKNSPSRNLINIHSAPSSPSQNNQNATGSSEKAKIKTNLKKNNKLLKAKDHLGILLEILTRCKNGPVWPHELITPQNYSKQLKSVDLLTQFVDNLKLLLNICLSTKQISTISSTRSFSSPVNLRFLSGDKSPHQIDKKWAIFALNNSFSTCNRHYAGRSLQIYRALNVKINSLGIMGDFVHRLKDTVADSNEDVQGYVTEILLTLKMNVGILSNEYIMSKNDSKKEDNNLKNKSKSLKLKHEKMETKKKYSTALGSEMSDKMKNMDVIKQKSATLSRKQVNQLMNKQPLELQRFSTKYKHQISYRKCLTLSLFNYKWQVLQDRIGTSILSNRKNSKFSTLLNIENQNKCSNHQDNNLKILVHIFWLSMCLLESDYEHEFNLACDILEQILLKIDLSQEKNEFKTNLELFSFRINWPGFPGLQNLLLKGCTNEKLNEKSQNLLILLIPYCSKLNFIDPCGGSFYGLWGLSMNLISILPTMILNYENPNDLCVKAAEEYCKMIKEICEKLTPRENLNQSGSGYQKTKIEQLKNLLLVIQLYTQKSFGKDKNQWTKCVITYLSEFFHLCQCEQTTVTEDSATRTNFYFNWIVLFIELLEKSNNLQYQSAILTCLTSLLNFINFGDNSAWSFINEELLRVVSKFINTELWSEILDLIKLTVGKSSSLLENDKKLDSPRFYLNEVNSQISKSQVPSSMRSFYGKKELPGRTLDFDFDFSWFVPISKNSQNSPNLTKTRKSSSNLDQVSATPPLNLINLHSNKQFNFLNLYLYGSNSSGWKKPHGSQVRTREKLLLIYNVLNKSSQNMSQIINENYSSSDSHKTSIQKSPSVLFENSLNSSEPTQKTDFRLDENDENLNLITNTTLNNSGISDSNSLASRISKRASHTQIQSPNTTASSDQSSKSSNTSANQTSSNNSFNQTSFVFSPEKDKEESPKNIKSKSTAPIIAEHAFSRTHNRANSMSINKQGSIINIVGSGLQTYAGPGKTRQVGLSNITPGVSQQIINTIDDNIFINNTFSFLDDLESNAGDYVMMPQVNQQKDSENKQNVQYENFPWHAILPAKDENSDQQKSQTLSENSSSDVLSKSFSSTSDIKTQISTISSKTKPMAPKIMGSATIGVATGISTLKGLAINQPGMNSSNNNADLKPGERRRSVTRIISSDNIDKNSDLTFKKEKQILPTNSSNIFQTNLIYDHRSEMEKSNDSLNSSSTSISYKQQPIIRQSPNIKNNSLLSPNGLLKTKPNILKIPNANNASNNLLSPEDSQRSLALSLLTDKSRSLSKSNIDDEKSSRTYSNTNLEIRITDTEEDQYKIEMTVKNIYHYCMPIFNILNLNQDEIQQAWKSHLKNMLNRSRASSSKLELAIENAYDINARHFNPLETFYLFKKLFNDARHRLNSLLSECYQYLTRETKLFLKLEKHLVIILDLLNTKLDCPVVYFDQEWFMRVQELLQATSASPNKSFSKSPLKVNNLVSVSFIDTHKRILWEIGENYDTFVYIKHDVTDSLDSIKKLEKSSATSLHGSSEINSKIEKFFKKIDLSKKFCKLVSQFMILLQSYSKLLPNLTRNLSNITLTDLSLEMSNLKRCLINASNELELNGRLSPMFPVNLEDTLFNKSPSFKTILPNSKEMLIYWILESIKQENYTQALEYYKIAQKNWPNDFNKNTQSVNELNFDLILVLACELARQTYSNMIAIIEPEVDFVEISQNVLHEIIEITNMVSSIDKKFKENISSVLNDNENEDDEIED